MRLVNPEFLWLLLLLIPLAYLYSRKGKSSAVLFSSTAMVRDIGIARKVRPGDFLLMLKIILRLIALALLILALARPQYGSSYSEVEASGIDIMLAVDISGSMEALDFTLNGEPANRLAVVKKVVNDFITERPNDRIGLLVFAGKPYLISPLTLDHDWLRKRLNIVKIGMTREEGTAVGSAIASGVNRLRGQKAKSKVLIVLTDGRNNAGSISPTTAAEAAETLGIKVYTIGAGTHGEAPVPTRDMFGRMVLMNMPVDIDEESLQEVAQMTGATYFRATDTASLQNIYGEINRLEKTTRTIRRFENYHELFPWLLLVFLLICGLEIFYTQQRIP